MEAWERQLLEDALSAELAAHSAMLTARRVRLELERLLGVGQAPESSANSQFLAAKDGESAPAPSPATPETAEPLTAARKPESPVEPAPVEVQDEPCPRGCPPNLRMAIRGDMTKEGWTKCRLCAREHKPS